MKAQQGSSRLMRTGFRLCPYLLLSSHKPGDPAQSQSTVAGKKARDAVNQIQKHGWIAVPRLLCLLIATLFQSVDASGPVEQCSFKIVPILDIGHLVVQKTHVFHLIYPRRYSKKVESSNDTASSTPQHRSTKHQRPRQRNSSIHSDTYGLHLPSTASQPSLGHSSSTAKPPALAQRSIANSPTPSLRLPRFHLCHTASASTQLAGSKRRTRSWCVHSVRVGVIFAHICGGVVRVSDVAWSRCWFVLLCSECSTKSSDKCWRYLLMTLQICQRLSGEF